MKITALLSFVLMILFANPGMAALNVPIDVGNWADVSRADELVSGGIPLPRGAVTDLNALKITDASGNTVPAQFRALTKWWRDKHENGKSNPSISWVQCNFLSTVDVKQNTRYFLKDGGGNSVPATPLQVTDADTTVTVVTGPLKFVLSRNSFTLFQSLWFDANNNRTYESSEQLIKQSVDNGGVISAGDWALGGCTPGTKHFSGTKPVDRIVVEESGPLKTVLRVEGRHYAKTGGVTKGLLGFQVFITAYAGSPSLDVQWAVTNIMLEGDRPPNAGGSTYTYTVHPFESYDLMLNFNLEQNLSWKLLGESEVTGTGTGRLFQNGETFSITSGTNGKDALGAAALTDGKITIMTAMRDFAVNQPKAISVSGSQLIYELFPKNASGNPYALDPASRKNSRFCLTFKAGGAQQGDLAELTQKVNAPLRIFAPQEWYQATGAWTRGFGVPAGSAWNRQQPSAWTRLNKSSSNTYRHWQTGQTVKTSWEFDGMQEEFNGGGDHWGLTSPFYSAVMLGSPAEFEAAERSTFYFNDIVPVHNSWYDDPWKTYDFYLNVESTTPIRNLSVVHRISTNTNAYPGWTWRRSNTPDDGHMSHHELLEYYKLTGDYATLDAVKSFGINALLSV
ncbi:MAG: hypothetical protein JNL74_04255, partial [Fibrobacteres bacterium]|nr:hypothetical protein [Fibrobacterota bacterium]